MNNSNSLDVLNVNHDNILEIEVTLRGKVEFTVVTVEAKWNNQAGVLQASVLVGFAALSKRPSPSSAAPPPS